MIDNTPDHLAVNFSSHLTSERDALRAFITLLENEQQALLTQDSEQLLNLAEAKTQATNNLIALSNTRRRLINPNAENLDTSAWILKNAPSCHDIWNEIRELATRAHNLNKINGDVIQLKLRSNQQALTALLSASENIAGLYGRDGQPSMPIVGIGRTLGSV